MLQVCNNNSHWTIDVAILCTLQSVSARDLVIKFLLFLGTVWSDKTSPFHHKETISSMLGFHNLSKIGTFCLNNSPDLFNLCLLICSQTNNQKRKDLWSLLLTIIIAERFVAMLYFYATLGEKPVYIPGCCIVHFSPQLSQIPKHCIDFFQLMKLKRQ